MKKTGKILIFVLMALLYFDVFRAGYAEERVDTVDVPIIMYHRISKAGDGNIYTVTPEMFEKDVLYLEKCGCSTVTVADLIAYVYDGVRLPENPVMITFDDGEYGVYKYAYPILQKHEMRAVAAIIGSVTDKYTEEGREDIHYPNLTWPLVSELSDSGVFEIQNHSYDLHRRRSGVNGALARKGESPDSYFKRLSADIGKMQRRTLEMTGVTPDAFMYPFGARCSDSERVLMKLGIRASLGCGAGVCEITRDDPECLYGLKRNNRVPGHEREKFFRAIGIGTR